MYLKVEKFHHSQLENGKKNGKKQENERRAKHTKKGLTPSVQARAIHVMWLINS